MLTMFNLLTSEHFMVCLALEYFYILEVKAL